MNIAYVFLRALSLLCDVYIWLIFITAMLSWFVSPQNRLMQLLRSITEPVLYPFRLLTRKFMSGGMFLDISPLLAYFALRIVNLLITRLMWMVL